MELSGADGRREEKYVITVLSSHKYVSLLQSNAEVQSPGPVADSSSPDGGGGGDVNLVTLRSVGGVGAGAGGDSVLHRVGNQQIKWQRTVIEQRRNIYDRRTILN